MKQAIIITVLSFLSTLFSPGVAHAAPGEQKIILLTSLAKPRLERKLERIFHRKMKKLPPGVKVEVQHRTDAYGLHAALMNPEIDAVIWVSHGSFKNLRASQAAGGAIAPKPMLIDYRGDDVASVLTRFHSELKFLSVVGCNSKQILDYQENAIPGDEKKIDEELDSYIPDQKVVAQWALKRASKRARSAFISDTNKTVTAQALEEPKTSIRFTRKIPSEADARYLRPIRIYLAGRLLGVLPSGEPGEDQAIELPVPNNLEKLPTSRWNVRVETGQHVETSNEKIIFGEISVQSPKSIEWMMFTDRSGTPFGVNFRLFLPKSLAN